MKFILTILIILLSNPLLASDLPEVEEFRIARSITFSVVSLSDQGGCEFDQAKSVHFRRYRSEQGEQLRNASLRISPIEHQPELRFVEIVGNTRSIEPAIYIAFEASIDVINALKDDWVEPPLNLRFAVSGNTECVDNSRKKVSKLIVIVKH